MSERERLDATSGPASKSEKAPYARMLRDDEMDLVSGGATGKHVEEVTIEFLRDVTGARP